MSKQLTAMLTLEGLKFDLRNARAAVLELQADNLKLRTAIKTALSWVEIAHRPPVSDQLESGRMVYIRLHALADLRAAILGDAGIPVTNKEDYVMRKGLIEGLRNMGLTTCIEAADALEKLQAVNVGKSRLITAQLALRDERDQRIQELESDLAAALELNESNAAEIKTMRGLLELDPES